MTGTDPHLWLEEVTGEDALSWVRQRNRRAEDELQDKGFDSLKSSLREILDSPDRIPGVSQRGEHLYNFWTDADHPQGIWRRTTVDSYRSEDPEWEVLLDLDELSAQEEVTWVWHGAAVLRPEQAPGGEWRHALISLSPGGSDADVTREFDLVTKSFVPASEGGFHKPEGKGGLSWIDVDTVYLSHDTPATTSGYPQTVRRWRRGTPLEAAEPVVSVEEDHLVAGAGYDSTPGYQRHIAQRVLGFYDSETYLMTPQEGTNDTVLTRVEVPTDVRVSFHRDLVLLLPRTTFSYGGTTYAGGSLITGLAEPFLAGDLETAGLTVLFEPDGSSSLQGLTATKNVLLLTVSRDVIERVEAHWRPEGEGTVSWRNRRVFAEITGSLSVRAVDDREDDQVWITANDFLTPTTLYRGDVGPVPEGRIETYEQLKQAPERFDASGLSVSQRFATSDDGTRIPYFLIGPADVVEGSRTETQDSPATVPTVLYGYGGFEVSQTPGYLPLVGKAWLETGGAFAVANIRGGGEYGPEWHQAALRENRHKAFEDFAAVARDLVETGVTTVPQLACRGGSNGGLLTGNMLVRYPELFGAVVIQVPLLDMKRFARLLAGASWRAEYGDPDTGDWEFLKTFSPYHLLEEDRQYPPVLLTTSTRDDRVHPGHARKMTAALEELGADVRYWENTQGGHGGAANPEQQATMNALIYRFLARTLPAS